MIQHWDIPQMLDYHVSAVQAELMVVSDEPVAAAGTLTLQHQHFAYRLMWKRKVQWAMDYGEVMRVMPSSYILEAAVQDLQLLAGETCLGFKLLQALGAMADCRQLELIFDAVWNGGREKVRCRHTLAQMSNSEGRIPITVEISTTAY